jgi:non-specific serine/threonine protein kinase
MLVNTRKNIKLSEIKALFDTHYAKYIALPETIPSHFGVSANDLYLDTVYRFTKDIGSPITKEALHRVHKYDNVKRALDFLKRVNDAENIPFRLMPHQHAAIIDGMFRTHYGIFFEMRLGKTITALILSVFWYYLYDNVKTVLVLAPLSAVETWEKEAKRIKEPINVINLPMSNGKEIKLDEDKLILIITNYEYLRTKKAPTLLSKLKVGEFILILDEGHRVKNVNTKTHKISYALSNMARKVLLLTGTPLGSGLEDIYGIAKCLHSEYLLGVKSLTEFRNTYMFPVVDRFWKPKKESYDRIIKSISKFSISAKQSDVFKEATVQKEVLHYRLNSTQRKYYDSIKEGILAELEDGVITINNALVESMKLLQVLSGFVIIPEEPKPRIEHFDTEKEKLLIDIFEDYTDQAVVWIIFDEEEKRLLELFKRYKIPARAISGSTPPSKRSEILKDFHNGMFRVLISKASIFGTGIDLSNAKLSIFYSRDYSYINRHQALSRQLNLNKPGVYTVIDLVCSNTIDEKVLEIIESKEDLTTRIKDATSFKKLLM